MRITVQRVVLSINDTTDVMGTAHGRCSRNYYECLISSMIRIILSGKSFLFADVLTSLESESSISHMKFGNVLALYHVHIYIKKKT